MLKLSGIAVLAKHAVGVVLGLFVLWVTADRVAPSRSEVVVHVMETSVSVSIDDRAYWVDASADTTVTCQLP
jgi:hypothetical protein